MLEGRTFGALAGENTDAHFDWIGSDGIGSDGIGSDQIGSVRFGSVRFGSVRFGSVRFGSVRFGSVRFGSVRFGSVRVGSVRVGSGLPDPTRPDPRERDLTRAKPMVFFCLVYAARANGSVTDSNTDQKNSFVSTAQQPIPSWCIAKAIGTV